MLVKGWLHARCEGMLTMKNKRPEDYKLGFDPCDPQYRAPPRQSSDGNNAANGGGKDGGVGCYGGAELRWATR